MLADSVTGITSLTDYGFLGLMMFILFSFAGVVIRTLWKMYIAERDKYEALQELFRTEFVGALKTSEGALERVLPIVVTYQERERGRDGR